MGILAVGKFQALESVSNRTGFRVIMCGAVSIAHLMNAMFIGPTGWWIGPDRN